jgi:hypothetical protein
MAGRCSRQNLHVRLAVSQEHLYRLRQVSGDERLELTTRLALAFTPVFGNAEWLRNHSALVWQRFEHMNNGQACTGVLSHGSGEPQARQRGPRKIDCAKDSRKWHVGRRLC